MENILEYFNSESPQLKLPRRQRSRIDQTKRHGFRPSVRPSVRRHRRQCAVTAAERDRRPGADRRTDHGRLVCGPPITPVRRHPPPLPPHGPGNHGPTTHQPAHHFPLHYVGPPSYPAPSPGRPVPPPPGLVLLTGPRLPSLSQTRQQTNKRTGTSVCAFPLAPSSQRWRPAPRDLLAPARAVE